MKYRPVSQYTHTHTHVSGSKKCFSWPPMWLQDPTPQGPGHWNPGLPWNDCFRCSPWQQLPYKCVASAFGVFIIIRFSNVDVVFPTTHFIWVEWLSFHSCTFVDIGSLRWSTTKNSLLICHHQPFFFVNFADSLMSLVLHFTNQGQLVIWLMRTETSASVQHVGVSPSGQRCTVGNGRPGPISFSLHVDSINAAPHRSPPFQTSRRTSSTRWSCDRELQQQKEAPFLPIIQSDVFVNPELQKSEYIIKITTNLICKTLERTLSVVYYNNLMANFQF